MEQIIFKDFKTAQDCLQFLKDINNGDSVHKLSEDNAKQLIDWFIDICWQLDDLQDECFSRLVDITLKMPEATRFTLIPYLVDKSFYYSHLIFLAKRLFSDFPKEKQQQLEIKIITWTQTDDYTLISQNEYNWRIKQGLPCRKGLTKLLPKEYYTRPMSTLDLECFYVSLELTHNSNTPALVYIH